MTYKEFKTTLFLMGWKERYDSLLTNAKNRINNHYFWNKDHSKLLIVDNSLSHKKIFLKSDFNGQLGIWEHSLTAPSLDDAIKMIIKNDF